MKLYVASSWRNGYQPRVVRILRGQGHDVYDFRNPSPEDRGFHWSEIDPVWEGWTARQYIAALRHPLVKGGFNTDFEAMLEADGCVLVLPCGRSAHLEAGYFVGAEKPLWILLAGEFVPELMYKLAETIPTGAVFAELGPLLVAVKEYAELAAEASGEA